MQLPLNSNDPKVFASEKEICFFDRKSARKDTSEIAKHLCVFANALGGKLVIGIEDSGEITGFMRDGARNIEDFEQAAITGCTPSPNVSCSRISVANNKGEADEILVMDILPSPDRIIARREDNEVFL